MKKCQVPSGGGFFDSHCTCDSNVMTSHNNKPVCTLARAVAKPLLSVDSMWCHSLGVFMYDSIERHPV